MNPPNMKIKTYLDDEFKIKELEKDVREGFTKSLKEISPKWFYDNRGSELFEEIMLLDEYYQTRREREILNTYAEEISDLTQATTLVELGSGNSEKTLTLLRAMVAKGCCTRFVPFDFSESALEASINAVQEITPPDFEIEGVVGDFHYHLDKIPHEGRRLIIFLGGTIGNFRPEERKGFLADISNSMDSGDYFLIGSDLIKDKERIIGAYNDTKGVTSEFNLNILQVLNNKLGGNFNLSNFSHKAIYNEEMNWIEMRLKSKCNQEVALDKLDMCLNFSEGEEILTEISAKFSTAGMCEEIETAGLKVVKQWQDEAADYLVTLAVAP